MTTCDVHANAYMDDGVDVMPAVGIHFKCCFLLIYIKYDRGSGVPLTSSSPSIIVTMPVMLHHCVGSIALLKARTHSSIILLLLQQTSTAADYIQEFRHCINIDVTTGIALLSKLVITKMVENLLLIQIKII